MSLAIAQAKRDDLMREIRPSASGRRARPGRGDGVPAA